MTENDFRSTSDTDIKTLSKIASESNLNMGSEEFARQMDENDPIKHLKNEFVFPIKESSTGSHEEYIYLATNKLGLQPKTAKQTVSEVLENWAVNTVECHLVEPLPACTCEEHVVDQLGKLVGARYGHEIVAMNDLNVNLHLMLVSFYRPDSARHKILVDSKAAFLDVPKSHIRSHDLDITESLISIPYQAHKDILDFADIVKVIEDEGESIAVILLPGLLTRSGQMLDIKKITQIGREKGCMVGFILNDVVGNVELQLSDWGVDFACWDAGKFLNAGPCAMGCVFLHHKHAKNDFPKFTGWWAHRFSTRFEMTNCLERSPGADGYKISNEPPTKIAQIKSSLDIFDQTSIATLRAKSVLLIGYLENLLKDKLPNIVITTPSNPTERGAQLSVKISKDVKQVYEQLKQNGIICSYALPDIIIFCASPLYCSFVDIFKVAAVFAKVIA